MENFYTARAKITATRGSDDGESDEYPFPMEISSNRLDSYYTYMKKSSLDNFRDDAGTGNGVGILEGHKTTMLPLGRTTDARINVVEDPEMPNGKRRRVAADAFMGRDMELNNLTYANTNGIIRAIDKGILTDVSVGFYDAFFRCDICNRDVFEGGILKFWYNEVGEDVCPHFLGETYEVDGADRLCTAGIENARLAEVSIVFSGATPEAGILRNLEQKARAFYTHGRLDEKAVHRMNGMFNLRMNPREWGKQDPKRRIFDMGIPEMLRDAKIEGLPQTDETGEAGVEWLISQHRSLLAEAEGARIKVTEGGEAAQERDRLKGELDKVVEERDRLLEDVELNQELANGSKRLREENEALKGKAEKLEEARELSKGVETERDQLKARVDELDGQIAELNQKIEQADELAKLGQEARNELIEATLESGVRAYGNDFDKDAKRETLEGQDLAGIRERKDEWDLAAKQRFPGGRKTAEPGAGEEDPTLQRVNTVRQLAAFGIRA